MNDKSLNGPRRGQMHEVTVGHHFSEVMETLLPEARRAFRWRMGKPLDPADCCKRIRILVQLLSFIESELDRIVSETKGDRSVSADPLARIVKRVAHEILPSAGEDFRMLLSWLRSITRVFGTAPSISAGSGKQADAEVPGRTPYIAAVEDPSTGSLLTNSPDK